MLCSIINLTVAGVTGGSKRVKESQPFSTFQCKIYSPRRKQNFCSWCDLPCRAFAGRDFREQSLAIENSGPSNE